MRDDVAHPRGEDRGTEREEPAPPTGKPAPPARPRPPAERPQPETDEHPAPGIEHEPEPDGENIMPAKDRPGTL